MHQLEVGHLIIPQTQTMDHFLNQVSNCVTLPVIMNPQDNINLVNDNHKEYFIGKNYFKDIYLNIITTVDAKCQGQA